MSELFFSGDAVWFSVPALAGSLLFVLKAIALMIGGDSDFDVDVDDSGHAFQILSVQSIAAFAMGFGWAGLAALKGSEWSLPVAFVTAVVAGAIMIWILGMMLRGMHSLRASGNISIQRAQGCEGTVYVGVPANGGGKGQVRVIIGDHQRLYRAVTEGAEIPRNSRVKVVQVNGDNTVTVIKA